MACVRKRRGRWVVDFRDRSGKRHWNTYDTKKQADDALADTRRDLRDGVYCDPATLPTFEQVARDWLAVKRDHPASSFQFWTTQVERHFVPAFGALRIDQVTVRDVERFRNAKRDGADGHQRLQRATINQLLQTLIAILEYAVVHRYLNANPGKQVKRVRVERRAGAAGVQAVDPREVLTAEQAAAVIEASKPGLYRTFITTAVHTGARVGELLALNWEHLDLEDGKMRIERSLSWVRGEERGYGKATPLFGPPKTDSSYRTLNLALDLVHELKAWRLRSRYCGNEDLVFPNSLGKPLHRAFLHKGLQLAIGKASRAGTPLPHVSVHGLRHTFASLMIQLGKPVSQVSQILGHKNPDLTLKVYTHWFTGASSASAMADLAAAIHRPNKGTDQIAVTIDANEMAERLPHG